MRDMPHADSNCDITASKSLNNASFRLAVVVNFTIDVQPGFLFIGCEMFHDFHEVDHHFLANFSNKGRAFRRYANQDLAPVITRHRANDETEILESCHQPARGRSGVSHFARDRRHRQHFFLIEISEQKKLRERNVARGELLGKVQEKTSLHLQNDVRQALGIVADLGGQSAWKRIECSSVQPVKARSTPCTVKRSCAKEIIGQMKTLRL